MPPSCFKLVSNQKLMIIWDGEYIDHTNGKRKYYVRGYQQKPTEKSDEKKLDKTKEEENLKEGWKKAMKKADSIWEKEAEKEREYIKKRRQENK